MLRCYLMDPDTDVCQTEQPQISYSVDFTAEQSSAMGSPILLDREGTYFIAGMLLYRYKGYYIASTHLNLPKELGLCVCGPPHYLIEVIMVQNMYQSHIPGQA